MKAPMTRIEFSEQEKRALDYERYHHPHPHVQRKMEALWLKSQQLPHKDICRFTGIAKHTLCTYLQSYQQGGLEKLKDIKFYKPKSALSSHAQTIETSFRDHPPVSIKAARDKIHALTGITRSPTQVRQFLRSLGMRPRKVGRMPAKGEAKKQDAFKKKIWSHA
jgi:transposase